jgi:DNA-binding SARP family transcriptional activator/DNA-binding CsgD family transcriptional regulator
VDGRVQVRLLGPVDVTVGGTVAPVAGLRRKAVLAVLGLSAGAVVSSDRLIEVVWGDGLAPATAANTLQKHVSYLRRALGSRAAILARAPGYVLNIGSEATDVQVAERLIREAGQSTSPAHRASCLRSALALWRGRPLSGLALPFLEAQSDRLANLRLDAAHSLIEARLALGEVHQIVPELEHLTRQNPFHEALHGQLMLALYRSGRQAEALAVFRHLRHHLSDELGIEPGPAVRNLEAAILRQDTVLDVPRPSGLPDPHSPVAVVAPAAEGPDGPAAVPELLERSSQLRELAAALAGGRVVLVAGEAGIGKSALVTAFAERHRTGARFVFGMCDPLLTARALGPVHDIGRQLGGRLAALLAADAPREHVFGALLDVLDQPRVIVIEDAHWADEATLDVLLFLGRRIERTGSLLVVTYRDDELAPGHPLRTMVGRLPAGVVRRIRLAPLSGAAVAELARRADRRAAGVHVLTGGNPLLVTEVLAAGDVGVPLTVRDLMLLRFASLPPAAQEVVRLVAVVPARAEVWLVEAALRPAAAAVEAGTAAGLLTVDADTVGFRHDLLRRAVEHSLPAFTRRDINRRVLEVLAGADREVDVARLAHHAQEADDVDAVLRHAPEAARKAAAVAAHREAVGHYRAALRHVDRLPQQSQAELLEGYSVELYLSGHTAEAVTARESAVALRETLGEREMLGESLRWLARFYWWDGNRNGADAASARAVDVLEALPPSRLLARAYSSQALLHQTAYRTDAATIRARRAIELARRFDDTESLTYALTSLGSARYLRGDPAGRADLEHSHAVALAAGLADQAALALGNLATIAAEMRDYRNAPVDLDRALAFAQAQEMSGWIQHILGHRARLRLDRGDWPGAARDAAAALAEDVKGGARVVDGLVPLGLLQARRGDPAAAATLDAAAEHGFATIELQWTGPVAAARAEHAWLRGEDHRIAPEAARVFHQALEAEHPWLSGELAFWLRLVGELPAVPSVVAEPFRLMLSDDWRAAGDAWRDLGCPYQRALALAHGDGDDALEALTLLDALGARQAARRVRRQLRDRGARSVPRGPTRVTSANPAGLTGRQLVVLGLVTEGLADAEIAARLSLSPKTVGHHVSAILAKLGVTSRREAAAVAADQNWGAGGPDLGNRTASTPP